MEKRCAIWIPRGIVLGKPFAAVDENEAAKSARGMLDGWGGFQ